MRMKSTWMLILSSAAAFTWSQFLSAADSWPQFRGPMSSGRAVGTQALPTEIGPDSNIVWKVDLVPGHSSPVLFGDRIYLTGVDDKRLVTIALDRGTGKKLWEVEAPHKGLESIHSIGSFAQSSPATDGERIVSFFGSSGLYCYDTAGKLLWELPMGPFKNDFGAGSSPLIVGDRVILGQDHDVGSFLMSIDKRNGKIAWETDRSEFSRNFSTPVIWEHEGKKQIVIAASLRVVGYDFDTGSELWTVRGLSRMVCMTPVVSDDGTLYVAGWSAGGGDEGERLSLQAFDEVIGRVDANKNGTIEEAEAPEGALKPRFTQADRDKDGFLTRKEYDQFRELFDKSQNVMLAIRPGGKGDVSESHVIWKFTKKLPFCASPLFYQDKIFTVKDGGIFTSLDAKSGAAFKQARLPATGNYYSSPVGGDGKVYTISERGVLTVVSAQGNWEVLATADFGEDAYATPALLDGRIYLRTAKHLYCFGTPGQSSGAK